MKGYKGFNDDLTCRDFQYEVGKTYTYDSDVMLCAKGFHFCESPFDVFFYYYPFKLSRYAEVTAAYVDKEVEYDSKRVAKKLTINRELSLSDYLKESVKEVNTWAPLGKLSVVSEEEAFTAISGSERKLHITAQKRHSVSAALGSQSTAMTLGRNSVAACTALYSTSYAKGNNSVSTCTNIGSVAISEGESSVSVTPYEGIAITAGQESVALTTDACSIAAAIGDESLAIATAYTSCAIAGGRESIAIALAKNGTVSGELGCWLVLSNWTKGADGKYYRNDLQCVKVDGEKIKANTFYKLEEGKIVEVK